MIGQIICFTAKVPTPIEADLIAALTSQGHVPLVDSVHSTKDWFLNNFHLVSHRAYYNHPFPHLLSGSLEEVDFQIMGRPHFVVFYTTTLEDANVPDPHTWRCITKYLASILNGDDDDSSDEELKEGRLGLGSVNVLKPLQHDVVEEEDEETEVGEFVIERSLEEYYYKFESKWIKEADLMIYEVKKPFVERPFTVLIERFSTKGAGSLFTDLFSCPDWGKEHLDIKFLESLWTHLGLRDDAPFDMEAMLKHATEACYPNEDGQILAEPKVYRKGITEMEEVYGKKFC